MVVTSQIYYLHFWCVKTLILGGGVTAGVTKLLTTPPSKMVAKEQKKE